VVNQILIGLVLMIATTIVHAGCTAVLLRMLRRLHIDSWTTGRSFIEATTIVLVVVFLFLASLVEIAMWGATYLRLGALETTEQALYFSTVTYTTLGFGDVILTDQWRLLCSIEAANGIILFGWSTALVFAFIQRLVQARQ
jgi:hypothetical protein